MKDADEIRKWLDEGKELYEGFEQQDTAEWRGFAALRIAVDALERECCCIEDEHGNKVSCHACDALAHMARVLRGDQK